MLKVVQNVDSTDSRPWIYDDGGKIVALVTNGDRDLADKFAAALAMHEALSRLMELSSECDYVGGNPDVCPGIEKNGHQCHWCQGREALAAADGRGARDG